MVLDGWFLQHIEVNHVVDDPKKVTKAIWFSTYDSEAKEYVTWFFQSSGLMGKSTGTWSEETQTSAFTPTDLPPNTSGTHKEKFKTKDFIEGDYVIKANDGRTMFDMTWTRTRQKGLVPNPLRKQWTEIGTPIQPVPDEVKKLEAFLGEWDAEFINRPSVVSPNGGTSKGKMTGHWILDGRFLYGTTDVGNRKSIWIAGYDPNKKAYRYIRMTNAGQIDESLGKWDEKKQAFRWKIVNERPGMTRTSTSQIVGKGALNTHVVAKDNTGKVHMDLTIKATRQE